jgi:hypothetical protein
VNLIIIALIISITSPKSNRCSNTNPNPSTTLTLFLDMILNPEAYESISLLESEQMQFDEDYQCDFSHYELERILNLPVLISIALPFLFDLKEIEAHRLG